MRHRRESVGEVRLHWVEEGDGHPVVLLHGFPEFWYAWRYQIPALAEAGYRAVAPDLRGYNASDRPEGVEAYGIDRLVADVTGLVEHLGGRAHLVGHDWGGAIAWVVAARRPDLVGRLAVLNAPHPAAFRRALLRPDQLLRSWYVFFFQLPYLPELVFRASDYERVERVMRRDIRREDVLHETDFRRYVEALARPGALTAGINYYRAAFRREVRKLWPWSSDGGAPGPHEASRGGLRVDVPTLLVWGERDRYLASRLVERLEPWVPDLLVERIPDASHWVQVEAWERVNRVLTWFLGADAAGGEASPGSGGDAPGPFQEGADRP